MTPNSIVLLSHGEIATTLLPSTAQEVSSEWKHDNFFPLGVYLHKMMHLDASLVQRLGISQYLSRSRNETVSLSILLDTRTRGQHRNLKLEPNLHEIPRFLDTQLFYGNLLLLLTLDGCTILPLCKSQYDVILRENTFNHPSTDLVSSCSPVVDSSFGTSPASDNNLLCLSDSEDDDDVESMDISFEQDEDDQDEDNVTPQFLNFSFHPGNQSFNVRRPVRPVF